MRRWVIAFIAVALAWPLFSSAQSGTGATISMEPAYASPGSTVRFTAIAPSLPLAESTFVWRVNGASAGSGIGLTSIETKLGDAGETTDVSVSIQFDDSETSAEASVTPASLDLLWESEGYTAPFYLGRALSAAGTKLKLVAVPHFGGADPQTLIYTWRRGNTVLGTLSGKGKSSIKVDSPLLFGTDTFSVEVRTASNDLSARASARITSAKPPLMLYEEHPLFGILFHKALGAAEYIPETERTFVAYPFFAPVRALNDGSLDFAWRVNSAEVEADGARPGAITINAAGSDGVAIVDLDVGHARNLFYETDSLWRINFNESGSREDTGDDPFAPKSN